MQRKLLEIISVDCDVRGQLLIIYSALVKYLRKKNVNMTNQCISCLQNSRKYMIQLEGRCCVIFSFSKANKNVSKWNLQQSLGGQTFIIKKGFKQGNTLSPLLFNFALVYALRRVQVIQESLKLNGTYQLLVYADGVNIMGQGVHTIKKNREALEVANKEISLK